MLSFDLSRIKAMDESTKWTVYGYIRECQHLFPNHDDPYYDLYGNTIINSAILLFYDEPDLFGINGKSSFKYTKCDGILHIFGNKVIERKNVRKYKWKIKTNEAFSGTFGVIDSECVDKVKNERHHYLWVRHKKDVALVGSENMFWVGSIFATTCTSAFVAKDDITTIELDYDNDIISFSSEKTKITKTGTLKQGLNGVKFVAEFENFSSIDTDFEISFL